jgi:hypothetical protein
MMRRAKVGEKSPLIWGVVCVGLFLAAGTGCADRVLKPVPEKPIFGPGVMNLAEARQIEGRPTQLIWPEILDPVGDPEASRSEQPSRQKPDKGRPPGYYVLTARQCQALAAAHAVWGNILDEESELAARLVGRGRTLRARSAALQSDLLRYAALAERNQAAADALELFYRLAEAEAQWDLCQAALHLLDQAQAKNLPDSRPKGSGGEPSGSPAPGQEAKENKDEKETKPSTGTANLSERFSSSSWQAERRRWQRRQEEVEREIEHINSQLRPRLGGQVGDCRRIWPAVTLRVHPDNLDVEKAVHQGLDQRAELRALRRLLRSIDANDLTAVRSALEQWHPALGTTPSRFPTIAQWLGTPPQHIEAATREEQIRFLLARREKEVEEQIRQTAHQVQIALTELAQAQQAYQAAAEASGQKFPTKPAQLLPPSTQAASPPQIAAQLAFYEAQAALIHRVVAWKIAEVRLLEAMGILAQETGYPLPEQAWEGMQL